jgi:hypothetical protein
MTEDPKAKADDAHEGADAEDPGEGEEQSLPAHAFYSPDDPIARPEGEIPREALFSPDDPLRREETEEGVVTRLNGNLSRPPDVPPSLAWKLRNTADLMENFSRELRERGLEALKVSPDSGPVDVLIRSFVAGYLVGQMEDQE